jgi:hypothetical protein
MVQNPCEPGNKPWGGVADLHSILHRNVEWLLPGFEPGQEGHVADVPPQLPAASGMVRNPCETGNKLWGGVADLHSILHRNVERLLPGFEPGPASPARCSLSVVKNKLFEKIPLPNVEPVGMLLTFVSPHLPAA